MDCPPTLQQSISLDTATWRTVVLLTGCVNVKSKHTEVNTLVKKQWMCLKSIRYLILIDNDIFILRNTYKV